MATNTFGTTTTPSFRKAALNENKNDDQMEFDISKQPLFKNVTRAAEGQIAGQTPGFDVQATESREAFKAAQANSQKALREKLMGSGLRDTGEFIQSGVIQPEQENIRQRMQLERQLASDKGRLSAEQTNMGVQSGTQLLGLQAQGEQARAGIASQEKLGFAEIGSREGIAAMQTDTEKWKQGRVEELTRQGWDQQTAMQQATFDQQTAQANLDRSLQKDIEEGRLGAQDKQLAQQALQFDNEMDFKRWAQQSNLDEATSARIWQSAENAKGLEQERILTEAKFEQEKDLLGLTQDYGANQAAMDRTLTKDVESGRITLQEKQMAQQASQFNDEQDFKRWATDQGMDENQANRAWQSSESALMRSHEVTMQGLSKQFQEKGIVMTAVMNNLQNMPPQQAAETFRQIALDNGIELPEMKTADVGTAEATESIGNILDSKDYGQFTGESDPQYQEAVKNVADKYTADSYYETSGNNQQNFSSAPPATGSVMSFGGKLYEVTSGVTTNKATGAHKEYQQFKVKDVLTGEELTVKPKGLRSEEYGNGVLNP